MIESLPANMLIFTVNMHIYTYICLKYVWYVRDCHTYQIYILHGSSWCNIICKQIDLYIYLYSICRSTHWGGSFTYTSMRSKKNHELNTQPSPDFFFAFRYSVPWSIPRVTDLARREKHCWPIVQWRKQLDNDTIDSPLKHGSWWKKCIEIR